MNYKLKELNDSEITDFLLNPLLRNNYYKGFLVQKYPVNTMVDHIIFLDKKDSTFEEIGYVLYEKKEIITFSNRMKEEVVFEKNVLDQGAYVIGPFILSKLRVETHARIEAIRKGRYDEVERNPDYLEAIASFKKKYFPLVINDVLGTAVSIFPEIIDHSTFVDEFFGNMDSETVVESYLGNKIVINRLISDILCSNDEVLNNVIYPKVREDAEKYVAAGVLTDEQKSLSNYISKTKASKNSLAVIQVETMSGKTMNAYNRVTYDGCILDMSNPFRKVPIKDIKKVTHNCLIVYEAL